MWIFTLSITVYSRMIYGRLWKENQLNEGRSMEALSKQIFNVCVIQKCGCKVSPKCLIFPTAKVWLLLMRWDSSSNFKTLWEGKITLWMAEMLFTDKKFPFEKFHIGGYEAYFFSSGNVTWKAWKQHTWGSKFKAFRVTWHFGRTF